LTTHTVPLPFLLAAPLRLTANALVGQWGALQYHVMHHHTTVVGPFLKETPTVEDITLGMVRESMVRKEHGR
jgi:hypothetical protein